MLVFVGVLLLAEMQSNYSPKRAIASPNLKAIPINHERPLPAEVTLAYPPIQLMFSYSEYFMGGYNNIPLKIQNLGDGIYAVYHAQETNQNSSRKAYYNYISNGVNQNSGRITTDDLRQGFPTFDIDPVTNNPFVGWHAENTNSGDLECFLAYQQSNFLWSVPQVIFPPDPNGDEYIWPNVFFGASPMGTDYRRIYVYAQNTTTGGAGFPSENPKIAYTDISTEMLNGTTPFTWTVRTIPQMDAWHNGTTFKRPQYSFFVKDSMIGFMGYLNMDSTQTLEPDLFVLYNNNYGDGDFSMTITNSERYVPNPDSTFPNADSLFFSPINTHHMNVEMDNAGRLHMINCWGLQVPSGYYWNFQFVKDVQYDFVTQQFKVLDIEPKGWGEDCLEQEDDGQIYIPWREVVGPDEPWEFDNDFPFFWWDYNDTYNENNFKITKTPNDNYMAAVWQNSDKARLFNELNNTDFEQWADVPEIVVEISADNGSHWSKAFYFNSIDNPEIFGGMIPEYVYPCDPLEKYIDENGDTQVRVHFMFYNALDYNSFQQYPDENLGGYLMYMALDFNVTEMIENDLLLGKSEITLNSPKILKQNYPNPFNPTTTIAYTVPQTGMVNMSVYNAKGQLVKTLVNETQSAGDYSIVWNGDNNGADKVTSGIYFYKINTGTKSEIKKMLLIK